MSSSWLAGLTLADALMLVAASSAALESVKPHCLNLGSSRVASGSILWKSTSWKHLPISAPRVITMTLIGSWASARYVTASKVILSRDEQ